MAVSVGIVGLPNAGKSTLFNALLKKQIAEAQNYAFTTIEPNIGVVEVTDERLEKLKKIVEESEGLDPSFKIIPAIVNFVDIAGLVKGAHTGEGLGNQFLSHIREVDVIIFLLRDFKNENVDKAGSKNFDEDLELLRSELLLKDLETIDKRIASFSKEIRKLAANDKKRELLTVLNKCKEYANSGEWLANKLSVDESLQVNDLQLLSLKKTIIVINSNENELGTEIPIKNALRISAKLEFDLASLSSSEREDYIREFGYKNTGLGSLIDSAYETLGLISFFTAGPKEVRAWTVREGTKADDAAGVIHDDFKRGFIAAELINWKILISAGSISKAKDKGLVRTVGRAEAIKDGDVVEFKFNV